MIALAGIAAVGQAAFAFDIGSDYSFLLDKSVAYSTNIGAWTGNHSTNTAVIRGARRSGAQGGATTLLPGAPYVYDTYCVEIGETVNGGYQTHSTVRALLGSTTNSGGSSGPVTFDAVRTQNLELLWGNFKELVGNADQSAAFQLAQWEITFDNDLTLNNQPGARFWSTNTGAYRTIAQGWLDQIRLGQVTDRQELVLLTGQGIQDLVTPVPEPATMAALGVGVAAMLRRRKRN